MGNYNTMVTFMEEHGALLAAALMKMPGSDIMFTFCQRQGAIIINQYDEYNEPTSFCRALHLDELT